MKNSSTNNINLVRPLKHPGLTTRFPRWHTPWRVQVARLRNYKRINAMKSCRNEILLLRVFIRRVVEHAHETVTLEQQISMLRVISLACLALSRLVGTEQAKRDVRFDHYLKRMQPLSRQALNEAQAFLRAFGIEPQINPTAN